MLPKYGALNKTINPDYIHTNGIEETSDVVTEVTTFDKRKNLPEAETVVTQPRVGTVPKYQSQMYN